MLQEEIGNWRKKHIVLRGCWNKSEEEEETNSKASSFVCATSKNLCRTRHLLLLRWPEGWEHDEANKEQLFVSLVLIFSSKKTRRPDDRAWQKLNVSMWTSASLACDASMKKLLLLPFLHLPPPSPPVPRHPPILLLFLHSGRCEPGRIPPVT